MIPLRLSIVKITITERVSEKEGAVLYINEYIFLYIFRDLMEHFLWPIKIVFKSFLNEWNGKHDVPLLLLLCCCCC